MPMVAPFCLPATQLIENRHLFICIVPVCFVMLILPSAIRTLLVTRVTGNVAVEQ